MQFVGYSHLNANLVLLRNLGPCFFYVDSTLSKNDEEMSNYIGLSESILKLAISMFCFFVLRFKDCQSVVKFGLNVHN